MSDAGFFVRFATWTPKDLLITSLTLYAVYLISITVYQTINAPLGHLPGPWYSKFTAAVLWAQGMAGQRSFYIDHLHQKYGPTVRISPTEADFMDADSFRTINSTSPGAPKYLKDQWYTRLSIFPRLTIFSIIDLKEHGERRRLLAKPMSLAYLRQHFGSKMRDLCETMIASIKTEGRARGTTDILDWARLGSSDAIGAVIFGESFHQLEAGKRTEHNDLLDQMLLFGGMSVELPILRMVGKALPFKFFRDRFQSADKIIEGMGAAAVEPARDLGPGKEPRTVLAAALQEQQGNKKQQHQWDDLDIKLEALSLHIAGVGAAATVLSFLWWNIMELPDLQARIEQEVAALPESFDDATVASKCPLLNATIQEGCRLWAAVPSSLPRVTPPEGASLGGFYIPGGTTVCTQAYSMHRDAKVWPEPLRFNPNRFLPGHAENQDAQRSLLSDFGAGNYTCLGMHFSLIIIRTATAMLFRECPGIKLAAEMPKLEERNMLTWVAILPKQNKIVADFGEVRWPDETSADPQNGGSVVKEPSAALQNGNPVTEGANTDSHLEKRKAEYVPRW